MPYGGSSPTGALGFVRAAREIAGQLSTMSERPAWIVFASSSGGTQAGLVVGKALFDLPGELMGIGIDKGEAGDEPFEDRVLELADQTGSRLGLGRRIRAPEVRVEKGFLGQGYGVVGDLERRAIGLAARSEGLLLDPVYTGRAFGALVALAETGAIGRGQTVVFWHTGGAPALFPYASALTGSG